MNISEFPPSSIEKPQMEEISKPNGLTSQEAAYKILQYGYNELPEKKANSLLKFLSYFWGPIPWMIEIAAALSITVGHVEDFAVIMVLLIVNGVVGFWEEYQAGNTIAALKRKMALKARVMRDGQWGSIPARELVPGDLIRIRLGDIIPADTKLVRGEPLEVDQSALTGESLPVTRSAGEMVYSGTIIKRGEMDGEVVSTGQNTYFGKTAQLIESTHIRSHFQQAVLKIGDYLIVIALVLVTLILIVAILRGDKIITTLQFALILAVAAIPVAMPTVLSVTMAIGARILAAKQAIVSRLASIEELAGVDVLCSDKTGTLTKNQLTIGEPIPIGQVDPKTLIMDACLASRAEDQDSIDLAILNSVKDEHQFDGYRVIDFQPFDPVSKQTRASVVSQDGCRFTVAKGAPQVILSLAANKDEIAGEVEKIVEQNASHGFRSLGVARKDTDGDWQFLGIIPLYDPPRDDSRETIQTLEKMGVKIKMLTGDQLAIAKEIALQLGLGPNISLATSLDGEEAQLSESQEEAIEASDGFAQVYPENKYRIVEALKKKNHIVGMTGDGVNDAPALKLADAGIAVSGATDAAREAADIVLLTPGLSVIADAIRESRRIFQRMNSYAIYRIAETIRILLFMTLSILVFNFYPVTAIMIVLLAVLNDGAILSIAYDNVRESERPEAWNMRRVLWIASVLGLFGVLASFGLFFIGERVFHLNREIIQSLMYLKLSVAGHLTIFVTRTRKAFWSIRPAPILLAAVAGTQLVATLIAVYGIFMSPIGWNWALFVWVYALAWFLINDRIKLVAYRVLEKLPKRFLSILIK